jgi:uncharacterized membrane protein YoaK (UPF0700 family)
MKTTLKFLMWYLLACSATMLLSIVFNPPHAHVPVLVLLALSPLLPVLIIQSMIEHGVKFGDLLQLVVLVVLFVGLAYRTFRQLRKVKHEASA